jgi:hypothetical protein
MDSLLFGKYHNPAFVIYKYHSAEIIKKILESTNVWFRLPSTFNDPFEFNLDLIDLSLTMKEYKKRQLRTPELLNENIVTYKKAMGEVLNNQRNTALVFCTAKSCINPLMWSHYADGHKGICLGLRMPHIYDINDIETMFTDHVRYTDEIVPKRYFGEDEMQDAIMNWIFTKSSIWKYEEEVRTFIPNLERKIRTYDNCYAPVGLSREQICEIYYGVLTPQNEIDEIEKIISDKGYEIEKRGRVIKIKNSWNFGIEEIK